MKGLSGYCHLSGLFAETNCGSVILGLKLKEAAKARQSKLPTIAGMQRQGACSHKFPRDDSKIYEIRHMAHWAVGVVATGLVARASGAELDADLLRSALRESWAAGTRGEKGGDRVLKGACGFWCLSQCVCEG
eukprot:2480943-Amphidinium_carterae.2